MGDQNKNVPRLRFPGYTDAWVKCELGNVVSINSGRDYKHLSIGEIPVYGTGGYMLSVDDCLSKNKDAIGIGRKGTIDKPYILYAPFWTVDTLYYAIPVNGNDINFIHSIFQLVNWKQLDESTGVPSLSKITINFVNAYVPCFEEQTKIGKFFKQLDDLITVNERELNKLKNLKKSYLEKMFPKNGSDIPELRFPGYTDAWVKCELGKVITFVNGRAYKQEEMLDGGKYKILRVGNFYTNDSWYYSDLELPDNKYIDNGDLIYTWSATFGPHIWSGEKVIYHYHIWKVVLSEEIDKKFVLQILDADRAKIIANSNGSTMIHITKTDMESKQIVIPNIDEQRKIGELFKHLDDLIAVNERELNKLKELKKSYLKDMFV